MLKLFLFIAPALSLIILQPQLPWKKILMFFVLGAVLGAFSSTKFFDSYFSLWNFQNVFLYSLKQIDIIFAIICLLLLKREQSIVLLAAFFMSHAIYSSFHTTAISNGEVVLLILQRSFILTLFSLETHKFLRILVCLLVLLTVVLIQAFAIFFNNITLAVAVLLILQLLIFVYLLSKGLLKWSKDSS